jgi:hypothetical protein
LGFYFVPVAWREGVGIANKCLGALRNLLIKTVEVDLQPVLFGFDSIGGDGFFIFRARYWVVDQGGIGTGTQEDASH